MTQDARQQTMEHVETVVVGAGYSGLVAASVLAERGQQVVVLDARDRVGGRTLSVESDNGGIVDLGAQWIGPPHERLTAWREGLGIPIVPAAKGPMALHAPDGTEIDVDSALAGAFGAIAEAAGEALERFHPDTPWSHPEAAALDSTRLDEWIASLVGDEQQRASVVHALRSVEGEEPSHLSVLAFLCDVAGAGGVAGLADGAEDWMFEHGSQQLPLRLAEQLGDRVRLSHPVDRVLELGERVHVEGAWGAIAASHVVLAMPPSFASRLTSSVPGSPSAAARADVSRGAVIKAAGVWDSAHWRESGRVVQAGTLDPDALVRQILDVSRNDRGILVSLIVGDSARRAAELSPAELEAELRAAFEAATGTAPRSVHVHAWLTDPWTLGAYGEKPAPGALTTHALDVAAPVGRIHFAGTETATQWSGFLEGAVRAGERAADEILQATAAPADGAGR